MASNGRRPSTRQINSIGAIGVFAFLRFGRQPIDDTECDQVPVQARLATRWDGRVAVAKHPDGWRATPRRPHRPFDPLARISRKLREDECAQSEKGTPPEKLYRPLGERNPRADRHEKAECNNRDRGDTRSENVSVD
jgi:hypothetical protein